MSAFEGNPDMASCAAKWVKAISGDVLQARMPMRVNTEKSGMRLENASYCFR
jgi:hypothetical protein